MEVFRQPLALWKFLAKDLNDRKQYGFTGFTGQNATKFYFTKDMVPFLKEWQEQHKKLQFTSQPTMFPLWIESESTMSSPFGDVAAFLFFSPFNGCTNWKHSYHTYPTSSMPQ